MTSGALAIIDNFGPDTTPDSFAFPPVNDALPNRQVVSNPATIAGINTDTPFSVNGDTLSVAGGPFIATGSVQNGQSVHAQVL